MLLQLQSFGGAPLTLNEKSYKVIFIYWPQGISNLDFCKVRKLPYKLQRCDATSGNICGNSVGYVALLPDVFGIPNLWDRNNEFQSPDWLLPRRQHQLRECCLAIDLPFPLVCPNDGYGNVPEPAILPLHGYWCRYGPVGFNHHKQACVRRVQNSTLGKSPHQRK